MYLHSFPNQCFLNFTEYYGIYQKEVPPLTAGPKLALGSGLFPSTASNRLPSWFNLMTSPTCPLLLHSCTYGSEKNMHFSFWDHEILTHLCNVLLTHADESVLTGQKGWGKGRGVGCGGSRGSGARSRGADVTLSQSIITWFI